MYSMDWAKMVLLSHLRRHARVSKFFLENVGFTPDHLAFWLADSHESVESAHNWNLWKAVCAKLEELCPFLNDNSTIRMNSKQARICLNDIFAFPELYLPAALWTTAEHWRTIEERRFEAAPAAVRRRQAALEAGDLALFDEEV